MQASGALAVVVMQRDPPFPQDMNCEGKECDTALGVPATNIPYTSMLADWYAINHSGIYISCSYNCSSHESVHISSIQVLIIVSLDESRGYYAFVIIML